MSEPTPIKLEDLDAAPPAGALLARIEDLPDHGGKEVIFTEGRFRTSIFIQKIDGLIEVFLNYCPHAGTPLNLFGDRFLDLKGERILCRTHGALFDAASGRCVRGPCKGDYLSKVAHIVRDGGIYSL